MARGVSRLLLERGFSPLLEFTLPTGRRLDVAAISEAGEITAVEIKVSLADFARTKNGRNISTIATAIISRCRRISGRDACRPSTGLIVADRFGAAIVREAPHAPIAAARRKSLLIRFARTAAERFARAPIRSRLKLGLFRRALRQDALQRAAVHVQAARGFRHVLAAEFVDALDVFPAHAVGRHRIFRRRGFGVRRARAARSRRRRRRRASTGSRSRRASRRRPRSRCCRSRSA